VVKSRLLGSQGHQPWGGAIDEAERWVTEGSVAVSSGLRGAEWAAAVAGGGSTRKGKTTLLAKLASDFKNCEWIYRIPANPGMPRGGIVPPTPVLAPGSALGSRPRVALSSAQAPPVYSGPRPPGNSGGRPRAKRKTGRKRPTGTRCSAEDRVRISSRTVEGVRGSMLSIRMLSNTIIFI
jgi:hypothetical protein